MTKNNKLNRKNYFSFANTHTGFVNFSENIFNPRNFDKIYIIKGVFAQDFISKTAEKYPCECFINPINPAKTDAAIINRNALINGSLANFDDSHYPAIIINLGEYCDGAILNHYKEQIFELTEQKQDIYSSIKKFLKSANELAEYLLELSAKYLNEQKLISAIDRILNKRSGVSSNTHLDYRFINSVSVGELDTLEKESAKVFYVSNDYFTGFHFMNRILEKTGNSKIICPDALDINRTRAVYLKDEKILFALQTKSEKIYNEKYNYINMERFINSDFKKDNKQKIKFINKIYDSLILEASDCFTSIKNLDTELEKIYALSLNNNVQQKFISDFIKKL